MSVEDSLISILEVRGWQSPRKGSQPLAFDSAVLYSVYIIIEVMYFVYMMYFVYIFYPVISLETFMPFPSIGAKIMVV